MVPADTFPQLARTSGIPGAAVSPPQPRPAPRRHWSDKLSRVPGLEVGVSRVDWLEIRDVAHPDELGVGRPSLLAGRCLLTRDVLLHWLGPRAPSEGGPAHRRGNGSAWHRGPSHRDQAVLEPAGKGCHHGGRVQGAHGASTLGVALVRRATRVAIVTFQQRITGSLGQSVKRIPVIGWTVCHAARKA